MPDRETVAEDYTPCNTTAIGAEGGTNCCVNGAACLTSGLCYLQWDMSINTGACTDSSWNSEACFQGCPVDYTSDNVNTLFRCTDNFWCCSNGGNTTSCCNDPAVRLFEVPLINGRAQIYNGSAFAPGFALDRTASSDAPETNAQDATTNTSGGGDACAATEGGADSCPRAPSNRGEVKKVGVGVGVGIGVPLLAAFGAALFLLSKEKKRNRELGTRAASGLQPSWGAPRGQGGVRQQTLHEMPGGIGGNGVKEMAGNDRYREMPAYSTIT